MNAGRLHEAFVYLVKDLSLDASSSVSSLIADDMKAVYHEKNSDKKEQTAIMNRNHSELASKVLKLNERFIEGDIDRESYQQLKEKFEG